MFYLHYIRDLPFEYLIIPCANESFVCAVLLLLWDCCGRQYLRVPSVPSEQFVKVLLIAMEKRLQLESVRGCLTAYMSGSSRTLMS